MDHSVWRYLSRHLSHHAKTPVAPDLPGHGSSPGPGLGSIEEMADWIATKVVPPGGEAFTVIGHSMGGLVALELAARLPDMVSHLVLLACAAEMPVHPQLLDAANRQHRQAIDLILVSEPWSAKRRSRPWFLRRCPHRPHPRTWARSEPRCRSQCCQRVPGHDDGFGSCRQDPGPGGRWRSHGLAESG